MNLLLIEKNELGDDGRVTVEDRRARHLVEVLKVADGDRLRAGVVDGGRGTAIVERASASLSERGKKSFSVRLRLELDARAGADDGRAVGLDLVLALPRPAVLHRVLQHAAAIGVARLDLVNAWRVEKSFFQSPSLDAGALHRHLLLGLEQGGHTALPEVRLHRRLVPFVDGLGDAADGRGEDEIRLLAHPAAETTIERAFDRAGRGAGRRRVRLAIGPEGGWIDRELATFADAGFVAATLGPWILRSEAAVTAAAAQIALLRRLAEAGGPTVGAGALC